MSRAGYSDSLDRWDLIKWRGQVASAIRGKRGQTLLRALRDSLDAMPEKALITGDLINVDGEVCVLGCLAKSRGMNVDEIDPDDPESVARAFDIAPQLAREIVYENDECGWNETPENRWKRMRAWVEKQIR
jgi:hypothetical protein